MHNRVSFHQLITDAVMLLTELGESKSPGRAILVRDFSKRSKFATFSLSPFDVSTDTWGNFIEFESGELFPGFSDAAFNDGALGLRACCWNRGDLSCECGFDHGIFFSNFINSSPN